MATSVPSFDNYVDLIRRSGLLKNQQLDPLIEQCLKLPGGKPADCLPLANRLLEADLVTQWHHEHLLEGRHRGFFLGNYKLLKILGSGGMGAVYVAEHTFMHRRVAIKVLFQAQVDRTTLERFYTECRAIAALDHPNIIRAHDFDSNGEFLYLVMEYVEGPDLFALVKNKGPVPYAAAINYIRQAADGLAHAHAAGMVHRDIKPANLLLDPKGTIKVLDLGLARIAKGDDEKMLTTAGNQGILGTVDFLSPEQAVDSHNVTHLADVYSLGCTLYYLLTGREPFNEGSVAQRLLRHQTQQPPAIEKFRPDAPRDLVAICAKMMAKAPADRVPSADDVSRLLKRMESAQNDALSDPPPRESDSAISDTRASSGTDTLTGKADNKIHVRCDACRTVFRATPEKAERLKACPKCGSTQLVKGA